ncbi:MAG TPA: hypothetical protein VM689_17370 [Aliidongia sp.]|nr:hypothetical protein [Aliidongia sp.]
MADPTPMERADYLVRKLERFIVEGKKTEKGMPFKAWQTMARVEIANSFAEVEQQAALGRLDLVARRMLAVGAAAIVTIGFWGAVVTVDRNYGPAAALLIGASGLVLLAMILEFGVRRVAVGVRARARSRNFGQIEELDRQLKKFEAELRRKIDKAKKEAADAS